MLLPGQPEIQLIQIELVFSTHSPSGEQGSDLFPRIAACVARGPIPFSHVRQNWVRKGTEEEGAGNGQCLAFS